MSLDSDKEALDVVAESDKDDTPGLLERLRTAEFEYGPEGRNPSVELAAHAKKLRIRLEQRYVGEKRNANRKAANRKAVKKSRVGNRKKKR